MNQKIWIATVLLTAGAFAGGYLVHGSTHVYTRTVVIHTVTSPPKVIVRTAHADTSGYVNCIMQLAWFINVYPQQNQGYAPQAFGAWNAGPAHCAGLSLPPPPLH